MSCVGDISELFKMAAGEIVNTSKTGGRIAEKNAHLIRTAAVDVACRWNATSVTGGLDPHGFRNHPILQSNSA
jgi:hypothetical protein